MIRFVFRWAFRLLVLAIVLVTGLLLLKDSLARSYAEQQIRRQTGFDAKLGKVQIGILEPRVTIENLVLYNPPEFGGSPLLDAPDIHFEFEPREAALRRWHLKFLRLNLRELNLVESDGRTNIVELLRKVAPQTLGEPAGDGPGGGAFTGIDLMNLSIGRVRYTDLRRPRRSQDIQLGLENHLVRNVRSEEDFLNVILKQLFRAGVTIYVDDRPAASRPL